MEEKDEFQSLNEDIFDNLYFEKLENRLETDPLMLSGLLSDAPDEGLCDDFCSPICELNCILY